MTPRTSSIRSRPSTHTERSARRTKPSGRDDSSGDLRMAATHDQFPTDSTGLRQARASEVVELGAGDRFDLRIAPVAKRIGAATVRMLAYNGSIPGPTVRVKEGSEVLVTVINDGDMENTVHWHGLRLDNRSDGTHETQTPIPVGGSFTARCRFPDAGVYWYHPHIREDYGQEMGLYGNVIVEPADPGYWPPVHREALVERVILAPSERAVVDVLFDEAGDLALEHHTPGRVYPLARIQVGEDRAEPSLEAEFEELRTNADLTAERQRIATDLEREPDKILA